MSTFTNTPAYRLFLQLRNTLRHLINTTHDAQRGLNRLQFIPGSPGSPGHYRIDLTLDIPPQQTNFLSAATLQRGPAIPSPTDAPPLIRRFRCRDRSRSRDRLPLTTPSQPNHTTHLHQTIPDQPPAAHGPSWTLTSSTLDGFQFQFLSGLPHARWHAVILPLRLPRQRFVSHITLCSG